MIENTLFQIFGAMPLPRLQKCKAIYNLARECKAPGAFVDLGVWHGYSTIAMAAGARPRRVYAVDSFTTRRGWAGESYAPDDLATFRENWSKAETVLSGLSICLLETDVLNAVKHWKQPISFLHWDLGMDNRLATDLEAWWPHLVPGGTFAIHDTGDNRFGAEWLIQSLMQSGEVSSYRALPAGMHIAVKKES